MIEALFLIQDVLDRRLSRWLLAHLIRILWASHPKPRPQLSLSLYLSLALARSLILHLLVLSYFIHIHLPAFMFCLFTLLYVCVYIYIYIYMYAHVYMYGTPPSPHVPTISLLVQVIVLSTQSPTKSYFRQVLDRALLYSRKVAKP